MTATNILTFVLGAAAILGSFAVGWLIGTAVRGRVARVHVEPGFVAMTRAMRGMSGGGR